MSDNIRYFTVTHYRPSSLSHLGHPEVGLGCVSRAAAVRPGSGQLDLNTRRERQRGENQPWLLTGGRGRPVEPWLLSRLLPLPDS